MSVTDHASDYHSGSCGDCRIAAPAVPESGSLYFVAPLRHTRSKISAAVRDVGAPLGGGAYDIVATRLRPGLLGALGLRLRERLSQRELEDTHVVVLPRGKRPVGLAELARMQPLSRLLGTLRARWLVDILREQRLYSAYQPIVEARSGRVVAHEALIRACDATGVTIPPADLFAAARESNLLFQLDRDARLRAIASARSAGVGDGGGLLFINFNPTAIYDPANCLQSTLEAIQRAGLRPSAVVFEVVESDAVTDPSHLKGILDYYRERGYRVALDDLGAGFSSLNLLEQVRPDFVKLDMHLVRGVDADPYKANILAGLLRMAHALDVKTVVEGVETAAEWNWVREHGATLVQGFLFGQPSRAPAAMSGVE